MKCVHLAHTKMFPASRPASRVPVELAARPAKTGARRAATCPGLEAMVRAVCRARPLPSVPVWAPTTSVSRESSAGTSRRLTEVTLTCVTTVHRDTTGMVWRVQMLMRWVYEHISLLKASYHGFTEL